MITCHSTSSDHLRPAARRCWSCRDQSGSPALTSYCLASAPRLSQSSEPAESGLTRMIAQTVQPSLITRWLQSRSFKACKLGGQRRHWAWSPMNLNTSKWRTLIVWYLCDCSVLKITSKTSSLANHHCSKRQQHNSVAAESAGLTRILRHVIQPKLYQDHLGVNECGMLFMTSLQCPPLAIMDADLVLHLVALANSASSQQKYPNI